jgi:hypothetical protein
MEGGEPILGVVNGLEMSEKIIQIIYIFASATLSGVAARKSGSDFPWFRSGDFVQRA